MSYHLTIRVTLLRCITLAAMLLSGHSTSAEEALPAIQGTLTTLAWDQPLSGLYYMNNGKPAELKAYTGGFSMPVHYSGSAQLQFYADKESLMLLPKDRPAPVATATLDSALKHILLIFILKEDEHYEILDLDFSVNTFPPKSFRVFNFSDQRVVFALGDKPSINTIEPNSVTVIRQDQLEDKKQMVKVQLAQDNQGEIRLVYRSSWAVSSNMRNTVFILPNTDGRGGIQLRKFVERGLQSDT